MAHVSPVLGGDAMRYENQAVDDQIGLFYTYGDAIHIVESLDPVLKVEIPDKAVSTGSTVSAEDGNPEKPADIATAPTLMLSPQQTLLALQFVPNDNSSLDCWVYCDTEHAMFHCPYLTAAEGLYLA